MKRPVWNDGDEVRSDDLTAIAAEVDYQYTEDLIHQLFEAGEFGSVEAATEAGTADAQGGALRSYGFLGDGLRVTRVDASTVSVKRGWGAQFATSGFPAGESNVRLVRLRASFGLVVPASTGVATRHLVVVKWHTKVTTTVVNNMDAAGVVTAAAETTRTEPEVSDGGASEILLVVGVAAGSIAAAARPAVPAGYVALAEVLVSAAGLTQANPGSMVPGATPGITDLRPRLVGRKAAGLASVRRATCSTEDVLNVAGNEPGIRRWGVKAVGKLEVFGVVAIPAVSPQVLTLDQGHDWRDGLVCVQAGHAQISVDDDVPGGASDTAPNQTLVEDVFLVGGGLVAPGIMRLWFYSGLGSVDGTAGYRSAQGGGTGVHTGADELADNTRGMIFFADSTTGALKIRTVSGTPLARNMVFRVEYLGPLGRANVATVER